MKFTVFIAAGVLLIFTILLKLGHATFRSASSSASMQQQSEKTKTFSGTILREGNSYFLNDAADKISYLLDDAQRTSQFEGKKARVTGTVDASSNMIHVETIQEVV